MMRPEESRAASHNFASRDTPQFQQEGLFNSSSLYQRTSIASTLNRKPSQYNSIAVNQATAAKSELYCQTSDSKSGGKSRTLQASNKTRTRRNLLQESI